MKYEAHIKTGDYSYLGFELEGTAEEAVEAYKELQRTYSVGGGLPDPQWRAVLDEYLSKGFITNGGDIYGDLSDRQRDILGEIKKSIKRTKEK